MVVAAHQRHKSTGDMFVLARDELSMASNRLSERNLIDIKNIENDEKDDDQEQKKTLLGAPASHDLDSDAHANRWISCKVLDYQEEDNEDESFLGGKHRMRPNQHKKSKSSRRHEFKSAGNLSLLFSLFHTQQQQQKRQHQQADSEREQDCPSDSGKTLARVDGQNKLSRSNGNEQQQQHQKQTQRVHCANSNLAPAASSPHLCVAPSEHTNSISDNATRAAEPANTCTRSSSIRRESWSRAGAAVQRRRRLAAAASNGKSVMKLPRVELRPVLRTKRERVRRQMTTSRDNNAPQQHSRCLSLDSRGNCSAWLGAPTPPPPPTRPIHGGSESGLESQQRLTTARPLTAAAHKTHETNGAGVGETRTAQVSGAFASHSDLMAPCVAQPDGCRGERQAGRKVMRIGELDNAGDSGLLSFQGAALADELHNQRRPEQQQLAATLAAVDQQPPPDAAGAGAAGGQDARRCAMASNESSPILRPPFACQLAPARLVHSTRKVCCDTNGTVTKCTVGANQSASCIATKSWHPKPTAACNATSSSQLRAAQMDSHQLGATISRVREYADRVAPISSGQDQVRCVQVENVNSKSSQQETGSKSRQLGTAASVASKLVDTCASSWRLALMATSGVTSSAGSYKVAQSERERERTHEQPLQPLQQQQQQQQQQQRDSSKQRNTNANNNNNEIRNGYENRRPDISTSNRYCRAARPPACDEVAIEIEQEQRQLDNLNQQLTLEDRTTSGRKLKAPMACQEAARGRQHADTCCPQTAATSPSHSSQHQQQQPHRQRPSRSPVSLQRQTNARLARHKLKIQQQRQEQLTRLALREREYFANNRSAHQLAATSLPSTSTSQQRRAETLEIEILEQEQEGRDSRRDQKSSLLHELLERLSLTSPQTSSRELVPPVALVNFGTPASTRTRYQRQSIWRQQVSARTSVSLETCDNYRASTSATNGQRHSGQSSELTSNVIILSASATGDSEHTPERRRELRDMQQQLASGESRNHKACESTKSNLDEDNSLGSPSASSSTLSLNKPFCKICHLSSTGNESDKLISPCKCSGTMQYIHCGCLLKWLEISNRTNEGAISCELCAHEYTWHKRFNYKQIRLPKCSSKDILLHLIFLAALGVMLFCALAPIFNRSVKQSGDLLMSASDYETKANLRASFRSHFNGGFQTARSSSSSAPPINQAVQNGTGKLASDEKLILLCAAFFFIAFFVAIYTQMRTRNTLYGLIVKFADMNLTYYITEYDHGANTMADNEHQTPGLSDGMTSDSKRQARQECYHQHQGNNEQSQAMHIRNNGVGGAGCSDTRRKGSA